MSPRPHPSALSGKDPGHEQAAAAGFEPACVARVLDDALTANARIYAICGLQGSGKSTLAAQVAALARSRGLRVAVLSIDDFYLGRRERLRLGREVHPLLATRGPPGTHEVGLACEVLDRLRAGACVRWPRFDKLRDTRVVPSRWAQAEAVDLTLFEGWFLKTPMQSAAELVAPINALERNEDGDGRWRTYCNAVLGRDYPTLWSRLDRLLFLQPPGFEVVAEWRWQQECAMQARRPRRQAMTRAQVERFVSLFERVSRQALARLPQIADASLRLDASRRVLSPANWP
ncbi:kinase [Lysobacter antibioticus]|uniref:SRP54-type, GTPase domain protein n=1 Tax=Lysobacter antibioticus TaxID=84531 RepID=A0A0S2F7Z5_LYSAN|nr:kinase [Lysobacter antibioticus]ALN79688.1 SRP54-type, GTPase domain protein [Lysobacter antibioticus]